MTASNASISKKLLLPGERELRDFLETNRWSVLSASQKHRLSGSARRERGALAEKVYTSAKGKDKLKETR